MAPVLNGKTFGFYGFLSSERRQIQSKIVKHGGQVVNWNTTHPGVSLASVQVLYIVTNYWVSFLPDHPGTLPAVHVTEFWLDDAIAKKKFPSIEENEYFTPLVDRGRLLTYPVDYEDLSYDDQRVLLPCSAHNLHDNQVPLWPFLAHYLSKPMRKMEELKAVLMRINGHQNMSFDSLASTLQQVCTDSERRTFFNETLPIMAKAALEIAFEFPSSLPLMVSLNDSKSDAFSTSHRHDASMTSNAQHQSRFRAHVASRTCHLTRQQVFCLLCHCFFGTFPMQAVSLTDSEAPTSVSSHPPRSFPKFNMVQLLTQRHHSSDVESVKLQKLRTILQYFLRVAPTVFPTTDPRGTPQEIPILSYTRVALCFEELATNATTKYELFPTKNADTFRPFRQKSCPPLGEWVPIVVNADTVVDLLQQATLASEDEDTGRNHSAEPHQPALQRAQFETTKLIEALNGHVHMGFANSYPGGGVFEYGFVQEEILFSISPELMVACAIFERLHPNEVFLVTGAEQFSKYEGYAWSYRFGGANVDPTPMVPFVDVHALLGAHNHDSRKRFVQRQRATVGMDAMDYRGNGNPIEQFSRLHVWRELVKCFVGFCLPQRSSTCAWPIATGNWGGGSFCGNMELKFLIQWIAAGLHGKVMNYVIVDADQDEHRRFMKTVAKLNELCCGDDAHGISSSGATKATQVLRKLVRFLFELEDFTMFVSSEVSVLDLALQHLQLEGSS